jgi:uncharacterized protein (TIGR03435 family)
MIGLANHLWQSTLCAALAAALAFALRHNHARMRHTIWLAASIKFLLPFSLLVALGMRIAPPTAAPVLHLPYAIDEVSLPLAAPATHLSPPPPSIALPLTALLLALWARGSVRVAWSCATRWMRFRAVVRAAAPLDMALPIEVRSTHVLIEPGVFGIFRPVLLLPERIAEQLTPSQLRAVLAHELCHVRRRDNLAAAVHMIVEALFWFHPLVWWIGARLVDERERACDEEVVRQGNEPEAYAEGILAACKLYLRSPLACVAGVAGADLRGRIERILTGATTRDLGTGQMLLVTLCGLAAIGAPVAVGIATAPPSFAQTEAGAAFEVASVRANTSGERMARLGPVDPARFEAINIPLAGLVTTAYDVHFEQVSGAPAWFYTDRFDVEAKPERPASRREINAMLQTLLAERFRLVVRRETREQPVYALAVDKGGPKLRSHVGESAPSGGFPIRPADGGRVLFTGVRMERLAWFLGTRLGRPVVDRTGLAGAFDFELAWDGDARPQGFGAPPPAEPGPSVFAALHNLGLKLESQRGPVEYLTVEHVERPTGN